MTDIINKLNALPEELDPIKHHINRYLDHKATSDNNIIKIFNRPWIAPENWGITLFLRTSTELMEEFKIKTNKYIPDFYRSFLIEFNGAFIYDMSLFGLTAQQNREMIQSHNLIIANNYWIKEFKVDQNLFYFGSRAFNDNENIGYFSTDTKIFSYRTNGEPVNQWERFDNFLFEEISQVEQMMLNELPKNIKLNNNSTFK